MQEEQESIFRILCNLGGIFIFPLVVFFILGTLSVAYIVMFLNFVASWLKSTLIKICR